MTQAKDIINSLIHYSLLLVMQYMNVADSDLLWIGGHDHKIRENNNNNSSNNNPCTDSATLIGSFPFFSLYLQLCQPGQPFQFSFLIHSKNQSSSSGFDSDFQSSVTIEPEKNCLWMRKGIQPFREMKAEQQPGQYQQKAFKMECSGEKTLLYDCCQPSCD